MLGLITILLYAHEKFEVPTHDRSAMGPFANSPPSHLTIDTRYRYGLTVYSLALTALYAAICIIGPAAFDNNAKAIPGGLGPQPESGAGPFDWPLAAAAFLVSTAALSDSNLVGRLEFVIRRYAHSVAYIPRAVRALASRLRTSEPPTWAEDRPVQRRLEEQRSAYEEDWKLKENARGELERGRILRANTLMALNHILFRDRGLIDSDRLDRHVNVRENESIFENLEREFKRLQREAKPALKDLNRFNSDAALAVAVAFSRSTASEAELRRILAEVGYTNVPLHYPDPLSYQMSVGGAVIFSFYFIVAAIICFVSYFNSQLPILEKIDSIKSFVALSMPVVISLPVCLFVINAFINRSVYYEEFDGNVMSLNYVISSGVISGLAVIVLTPIILYPIDAFANIVSSLTSLFLLIVVIMSICVLSCYFNTVYLRVAVRSRKEECARLDRPLMWSIATSSLHALLAAVIVFAIYGGRYGEVLDQKAATFFERTKNSFAALQGPLEHGGDLPYFYDRESVSRVWGDLAALASRWNDAAAEAGAQFRDRKDRLDTICDFLRRNVRKREGHAAFGAAQPREQWVSATGVQRANGVGVQSPNERPRSEFPCRYDVMIEDASGRRWIENLSASRVAGSVEASTFKEFMASFEPLISALVDKQNQKYFLYSVLAPSLVSSIIVFLYGMVLIHAYSEWIDREWNRIPDGLSDRLRSEIERAGYEVKGLRPLHRIDQLDGMTLMEASQYPAYVDRIVTLIGTHGIDSTELGIQTSPKPAPEPKGNGEK